MTTVYFVMFILSIISLIYIGLYNYKNIEPFFWGISVAVPVSILGYFFESIAIGKDAVLIGFLISFIDQTFLASMIFTCIMKEMRINLHNHVKLFVYGINFSIYLLTIIPNTRFLYIKDITSVDTIVGRIISIVPGPIYIFHKIFLLILVVALIWKRIELEVKGKKFTNHLVLPYFLVVEGGIVVAMLQELFRVKYNLTPVLYGIGIAYLSYCYKKKYQHDIYAIVSNIFGTNEKNGYVAFDNEHRLLAANDLALKLFPELASRGVDSVIPEEEKTLYRIFEQSLIEIEEGKRIELFEQINGLNYKIDTRYFSLENKEATSGIVFRIEDYTIQQSHEELLQNYDESLHNEIEKRTKKYRKIQQSMELRMADMIESRDSTRYGHVKRITDVTKIVVNTMAEDKMLGLTYEKAEHIIRAAALYDIGKMAVDDSILCKPYEVTPEEYEQIKLHPVQGSRMIRSMFENIGENQEFICIAENMARYHHERFDGTGYPEGLKGQDIPIEARIMTLIDVYDALVSERCYKEAMSFEEASREMLAGMGTQFDPDMKKVFQKCRAKMENYYKTNHA